MFLITQIYYLLTPPFIYNSLTNIKLIKHSHQTGSRLFIYLLIQNTFIYLFFLLNVCVVVFSVCWHNDKLKLHKYYTCLHIFALYTITSFSISFQFRDTLDGRKSIIFLCLSTISIYRTKKGNRNRSKINVCCSSIARSLNVPPMQQKHTHKQLPYFISNNFKSFPVRPESYTNYCMHLSNSFLYNKENVH